MTEIIFYFHSSQIAVAPQGTTPPVADTGRPISSQQAELEAAEYTGSASGEMVTVKMNGKHEVLSITIKPEAVDPDDIEMLEDLVAAAVNATVKQVDETAEAEMGKLTGGLNIPGL